MSDKVVDLEEWKQKKQQKEDRVVHQKEEESKEVVSHPVPDDCSRSTVRNIYASDLDSASTLAAQEIIDTTHKYLAITGMDCDQFKSKEDKTEHLKLWYFFSLAVKAIVFWNFGAKNHPFVKEIFDRVEICDDGLPRIRKETLYDTD